MKAELVTIFQPCICLLQLGQVRWCCTSTPMLKTSFYHMSSWISSGRCWELISSQLSTQAMASTTVTCKNEQVKATVAIIATWAGTDPIPAYSQKVLEPPLEKHRGLVKSNKKYKNKTSRSRLLSKERKAASLSLQWVNSTPRSHTISPSAPQTQTLKTYAILSWNGMLSKRIQIKHMLTRRRLKQKLKA